MNGRGRSRDLASVARLGQKRHAEAVPECCRSRCPNAPSSSNFLPVQVTVPKVKKTFCAAKDCKKHTIHKVTQYKTGKASLYAQGEKNTNPLGRCAVVITHVVESRQLPHCLMHTTTRHTVEHPSRIPQWGFADAFFLHQVSVVTTASSRVTVVRPSLSSTRRLRPPRRLCSASSVSSASTSPTTPSSAPSTSSLLTRKSKQRTSSPCVHCTPQCRNKLLVENALRAVPRPATPYHGSRTSSSRWMP